ncbi:hypothetical protein TSUD_144260 [Trifolium subterraneum]|uniref:Reverse transcriptase Ty1/copia-type domain-containing protein n=1 Tax=Trifolium subterraneum TaxID=3900 RepID=A0A2Z6NG65_TRISU|nr:hypothetical protein TSUD_144260 [Trifolium subterraneum]
MFSSSGDKGTADLLHKENGHMVIVIAEGARQDFYPRTHNLEKLGCFWKKASSRCWALEKSIKGHFAKEKTLAIILKYIDPTYMIRAVLSKAFDYVYCTLLPQSVVHGAMAGYTYTGYTSGLVNGRQTYIPFYNIDPGNDALEGYVNADYAGNVDTRKSLSGFVFTLFGVKEAIWLKSMIGEMRISQGCVKIHCNSQNAIHLANHQVYHERTKHIDIRLHFVRDMIETKEIIVDKVASEENPADMFTKSLPRV